MTRFRTLQGRLTALAVLAALVAIGALTVAFNLVLDSSLDSDATTRVRARADAALTTVTTTGGHVRDRDATGDAALDGQVWVYDGSRAVVRPPGDPVVQRAADALAGRAHVRQDVAGKDVRLYAAPVLQGRRQIGTVVAGQSLAAYDRTTDLALLGSVAFAGVLLLAVLLVTRATIGRALRPVREMTRSAAEWGEQPTGRRFGATPRPDELGELAETFDALLDRVAASLRHEQRLSAELSHELRTPLARITAEVELLSRRERPADERAEAYAAIARNAAQMSEILETLMAAARAEGGLDVGRSDLRDVLARVRDTWRPEPDGPRLTVDLPAAPAPVGVDGAVVERVLAPLLDNARRHARSTVVVRAAADPGGRARVTIADDGPGVAPADAERIFVPGVRATTAGGGAGLGLPLARRLARAAGGDVTLDGEGDAGTRGATFVVTLPA